MPAKKAPPRVVRTLTMQPGTAPDGTPLMALHVPDGCTHLVVQAIRGSVGAPLGPLAATDLLATPILLKRGEVLTVSVARPKKQSARKR